jgi:alkylation response protein AidB-like acyl-CoA dehydrogenase
MRFALTAEQRDFRDAVDALLRDAGGVKAARAWAAGDTKPGLDIWRGLAEIGLHGLAVPEESGGSGFHPVELCAALERIGYHAAPGPYVESFAASIHLAQSDPDEWLPRLAEGAIATLALPPHAPYAPNADIADLCIPATSGGEPVASLDPARSLFAGTETSGETLTETLTETLADDRAFNIAALLTSAQLLGLGRAALDMTVAYAKQRVQFGRPIGEYQAVKHQLADALVALEFARPLVFAAALDPSVGRAVDRDVSAAKVAASEAAYRAARTALQLHGAIGYTDEYDLSVYFKKIRALYSAWGTPSLHRTRVLAFVAVVAAEAAEAGS